jgi:hypothetical protein
MCANGPETPEELAEAPQIDCIFFFTARVFPVINHVQAGCALDFLAALLTMALDLRNNS